MLEVPLKRELEMTRLYLNIEKMRFDDRLAIDINVAEETEDALVPNLILQPLVENAIKHGISHRPGLGCIAVETIRNGGSLVITIRDNGAGFNTEKGPLVEGVGLTTTRARLDKLYGAGQSFHFVRRPGGQRRLFVSRSKSRLWRRGTMNTLRVLIVDDEKLSRMPAEAALGTGYQPRGSGRMPYCGGGTTVLGEECHRHCLSRHSDAGNGWLRLP